MRSAPAPAFTLIEILVSMTILTLMIIGIAQVMSNTSLIIGGSGNRLEADAQARLVLDRIDQDVAAMIRESDIDYLSDKSSADGNDRFLGRVVCGAVPDLSTHE